MKESYIETAKLFKAFCDENRLMIIEKLRSGEKCACHLQDELNIGQSTLSHHMKILCDSGVVVSRKEGKWTYYSISEEGSSKVVRVLEEVTRINEQTSRCSCEL